MSEAARTAQDEPVFGVFGLVLLGTLMLFTALLALPLHQIHIVKLSLGEQISLALPLGQLPGMVILWVVEIGAYFSLAWHYSRQMRRAVLGIPLGLLIRVVISALMCVFMTGSQKESFARVFLENEGTFWVYHLLAILGVCVSFVTIFRNLWRGRIDAPGSGSRMKAGGAEARAFAFSSGRAQSSSVAATSEKFQQAFASAHSLTPPADFVLPVPASDVFGVVSIPVSVVLEAVPEAKTLVDAERPVRIQLAYFVPQLARATVWLTWQTIFTGKADDLNRLEAGSEAVALLRDRWIRIPARNYVSQIPKEYFKLSKRSTSWIQLPEVEQEELFGDVNAPDGSAAGIWTANAAQTAATGAAAEDSDQGNA
ncbi:MAG: hypothetical protein ACYC7E_03235 [Armatimonadota bacterium]